MWEEVGFLYLDNFFIARKASLRGVRLINDLCKYLIRVLWHLGKTLTAGSHFHMLYSGRNPAGLEQQGSAEFLHGSEFPTAAKHPIGLGASKKRVAGFVSSVITSIERHIVYYRRI